MIYQAALRSRIYISNRDLRSRAKQTVAIRRGPYTSTHDLYEADSDFRYGAEAPDNPDTTIRVLTIMMARDW